MKIYTIGFTKKNASTFFNLLKNNAIDYLIDIRLHPGGQLSGFAKQEDLPFFLINLVEGCQYVHLPELAPSKEVLEDYHSNRDWIGYEERFKYLMDERNIPGSLDQTFFATNTCCLLCSEASPEHCHRRLVAERLAASWSGVEIIHL